MSSWKGQYPQLKTVNYTELAQFSHQWNAVTRTCRGLIYDSETLDVLARPFPKIHNWNEPEAPKIDGDDQLYSWSNKEDGSLGIAYRRPDGVLAIATRGSFASEQAEHATALLADDAKMASKIARTIDAGFTPLYEIVFPGNRIVLDYGDRDELIYLGSVSIETGQYYEPGWRESGLRNVRTFRDLMNDLSRENAEGWVAWINPTTAPRASTDCTPASRVARRKIRDDSR